MDFSLTICNILIQFLIYMQNILLGESTSQNIFYITNINQDLNKKDTLSPRALQRTSPGDFVTFNELSTEKSLFKNVIMNILKCLHCHVSIGIYN